MRFDCLPEVFVGEFLAGQESGDLIVREVGNEVRQSRCGGLSERGKQVIGV